MPPPTRRRFLQNTAFGITGAATALSLPSWSWAQEKGDRPAPPPDGITVLNPLGRVPVSLIIDDSTCLVNLNRFSVPQFAEAWQTQRQLGQAYNHPWRDWPLEIPDAFVRKFGEWSRDNGVKGKYSVVPYPACVGRIDRVLPGWTQAELRDSIKLVRELMTPNWDIHPEMVTHTWAIDTKTGHPYPDRDLRHQENWDFSVGKSADELADYLTYALNILKNVGLPCEGVTTPGGFGSKVMPALARATLESVRGVFGSSTGEIPHFFRNLFDKGEESVAPRVHYASGLGTADPRCVVSVIGCTGDWTGGWDNTPPVGADAFITPDLTKGRMVEVIDRGEPAVMVCHWTGIYFNGQELGFKVFQEVVRRLRERYGQSIRWMKLGEISRYWAAKELTRFEPDAKGQQMWLHAPFACPNFTVRVKLTEAPPVRPMLTTGGPGIANPVPRPLDRVADRVHLQPGTFYRDEKADHFVCCFDLPKGRSILHVMYPATLDLKNK